MKLPDALKQTGIAYWKDTNGQGHKMVLPANDLMYWRVFAGKQQSSSVKQHFTPRSVPRHLLAHDDWQPIEKPAS
jgi:hypothetical protein